MALECPEMAANDVGWEGLVAPIALVRLGHRATSLVTDIIRHELEKTATISTVFCLQGSPHVRWLTTKQVDCPK